MAKARKYELSFLFDPSQIKRAELQESIERILQKYVKRIDLHIGRVNGNKALMLSIKGAAKTVNACDLLIIGSLIRGHDISAVRWKDEPGDLIRQRTYPIVARIEQNLRRFINRALVDIEGIQWVERRLPPKIQKDVELISKRNPTYFNTLHPLEMAQFNDLVELITAKVSRWTNEMPIHVEDLSELLDNSTSLEEARAKLHSNTQLFSMWDDIFSLYFEDAIQWGRMKKTLVYVVHERHKIMHHQPMSYDAIEVLALKESDVEAVLSSAKRRLSANELKLATERIRGLDKVFTPSWLDTSSIFNATAFNATAQYLKLVENLENSPLQITIEQMENSPFQRLESELRQSAEKLQVYIDRTVSSPFQRLEEELRGFDAMQRQSSIWQKTIEQIENSPIQKWLKQQEQFAEHMQSMIAKSNWGTFRSAFELTQQTKPDEDNVEEQQSSSDSSDDGSGGRT